MDLRADAVTSGRDLPGLSWGVVQRMAEANWKFLRWRLASTSEERFKFTNKAPRYHSTPIKLASIH